MKKLIALATLIFLLYSCSNNKNSVNQDFRNEIIKVEKDFESAVKEKGLAEAFYLYADTNAVIRRLNDSIINGKENIRKYYLGIAGNFELTWTPDFVGVSDDGSLGYTYGTYVRKVKDNNGKITESKGIFHTVWKKQPDGTWKYVWD